MDVFYSFLKVSSMIATGLFAALGLLTKYKNEQGQITRWGKVALGGILLSSSTSLVLYGLETSRANAGAKKAKADAEATSQQLTAILVNAQTTASGLAETLKQQQLNLKTSNDIATGMERSLTAQQSVLRGNEKILGGVTNTVKKQGEVLSLTTGTLHDTERLLHPINSLQLRLHLTIPLKTPYVSAYVSRISSELDPIFRFLERNGNWQEAGSQQLYAMGLRNPMPGAIGIPSNSAFYPSLETEERASRILSIPSVELAFYSKPIDPTKFSPFDERPEHQADIRATLESDPTQPLLLHFYGSKDDLQIRGDLVTDPERWMLSGNLLSIQDLAGGQMFVSLGPLGYKGSDGKDYEFPERRPFYFTKLYLRISKRMFEIDGKKLIQYQTSSGSPFWCYEFVPAINKSNPSQRPNKSLKP